jgi:hypothetical protein
VAINPIIETSVESVIANSAADDAKSQASEWTYQNFDPECPFTKGILALLQCWQLSFSQ